VDLVASTGSSSSTSSPSAARPVRTRSRIQAYFPISAISQRSARVEIRGTRRDGSASMSRAAGASRARATALIKIEMHFLPDVYVTCDVCQGKRFNRDTLEIRYKEKNIAEVLDMTVTQALSFFENISAIRGSSSCSTMWAWGIYGSANQPRPYPEARRSDKDIPRVGQADQQHDAVHPRRATIGLHFADIQRLLEVLMRLVDMGNTMVVIEHNLDIIKGADHIIDLGPEGGRRRRRDHRAGTVEHVAGTPRSVTGSS